MEQILRGSFGSSLNIILIGRKVYKKPGLSRTVALLLPVKNGPFFREIRYQSTLSNLGVPKKPFLIKQTPQLWNGGPTRGVAMLVARVLRGVLKIRYLVLGGAVGGGVTLQKTYEDFKQSIPDVKWMQELLPSRDQWNMMRTQVMAITDKVKENVDIDPRYREILESKYNNYKDWFDQRLDQALAAAEKSKENKIGLAEVVGKLYSELKPDVKLSAASFTTFDRSTKDTDQGRINTLQNELMSIQLKYQKELEKLEKENRELRKQILLKGNKVSSKNIKKSLIDMYSEVLDELTDYDTSYSTQDHLPRVVVVGDQSSGKTSVLEMIAQARIFPRGAGEMMTRAPVKVTLSEGPYHIAQFKDSGREFDLTKEADLADLRREVELRMKNSVRNGKTVSQEVISMSVKGPGLQRMVLVDLPGIISTVTVEMAQDTRDAIRQMTQMYMSNPNAIILCIQDGSVDAERSNVTDLVAQMDPQGKRTIFVLTKVDLAEENLADPNRIRKILSGKLFPMRALGYYAVVTGRGNKDDSIQSIKDYEEQFFRNSKLFKNDVAVSAQVTTRNLSLAVAECFWKMVRETVEQQADAFKATRFNLETEWKNNYPRTRELDRDELFEKARGEILDEIINLSQMSTKQWEDLLMKKLWDKVSLHVFENIYLPAAQTGNPSNFNTAADIKLKNWADQQLPAKSVESGWDALQEEFRKLMKKAKESKNTDSLFDYLKDNVVEEAIRSHTWESKASEVLRVIQLNTMEDRSVPDKASWDSALQFLENSVKEKLTQTEALLRNIIGPSAKDRWLYWQYLTPEQHKRSTVKSELDKILHSDFKHPPTLSYDELTTVRKNVQRQDVDVDHEFVRETWHPVYRAHFLKRALARVYDCKKGYYLYVQGNETEVECHDVVLFWRVQQVLKVTSNALRQQIVNREARRLDKEIKEVLDDYNQDDEKKKTLLTGRRVTLAEELKRVRQIQEKLEEFIQALNKEK